MVYHITELGFGLAAWVLGLAALFVWKKDASHRCSLGSITCCAVSLCAVVFELARYADIEDVSAFLDTANAFRLAAGVLLTGTLIVNSAAMLRARKRGD